jgi:hypothetical protein
VEQQIPCGNDSKKSKGKSERGAGVSRGLILIRTAFCDTGGHERDGESGAEFV